jgi:hypothetical protein
MEGEHALNRVESIPGTENIRKIIPRMEQNFSPEALYREHAVSHCQEETYRNRTAHQSHRKMQDA